MSKREKLRRKLRNARAEVNKQEAETLLLRFGFRLVRVSGSHHIYEYEDGIQWRQIIFPIHGEAVKLTYVKLALGVLDELFPEESLQDENSDDE